MKTIYEVVEDYSDWVRRVGFYETLSGAGLVCRLDQNRRVELHQMYTPEDMTQLENDQQILKTLTPEQLGALKRAKKI